MLNYKQIENMTLEDVKSVCKNYKTESGNTLLIELLKYNENVCPEMIQCLKNEIYRRDENEKETALMVYLNFNKIFNFEILKALECLLGKTSKNGYTAYMYMVMYRATYLTEEIIKFFKPESNFVSYDKKTSFILFCENYNKEIPVKYFDYFDFNYYDLIGTCCSPLISYIKSNFFDIKKEIIVKLLCYVDFIDVYKKSALYYYKCLCKDNISIEILDLLTNY